MQEECLGRLLLISPSDSQDRYFWGRQISRAISIHVACREVLPIYRDFNIALLGLESKGLLFTRNRVGVGLTRSTISSLLPVKGAGK